MRQRSSLFHKYVFYIVSLVGGAVLVSSLLGIYYTYEESKTARLNLQLEMARNAAFRIETYVQGIVDRINWLGPPMMDPVGLQTLRTEYQSLIATQKAITELALADENGAERLRAGLFVLTVVDSGRDLSNHPALVRARNANKAMVGPVDFRGDSEPYATIAIPSAARAGVFTLAETSLKDVWNTVSEIKLGGRGATYVVDSTGHLIIHPERQLVLSKTDYSSRPQVKYVLAQNRAAEQGIITVSRPRGGEVLVAFASIRDLGWHVFVEEDLADAMETMSSSFKRTALLLAVGLLLSLVVAFLLARHMATPIRRIQQAATRMAAGELSQSIDVHTGDEVEALAREFNAMASRLQASYSDLERKVEERTRDLRESLEQQTATAEVLKTLGRSSFQLDKVLEEVARSVVKLGRASAAGVYRRESTGRYALAAAFSESPEVWAFVERNALAIAPDPNTVSGKAIASSMPFQIEDVTKDPAYKWRDAAYRTALAVPILREGASVGIIVAVKVTAEPFSDKQVAVINTFADQAGIAIENVRLYEDIQGKSRQLELANRHKSEFLANVSHELRTPLNAIIGFSEVLLERMFGELNTKQAEYLEDIRSSGTHLLALINDVLNLSKIEAGRMELELSAFDLVEAVNAAVALVRERATRAGVTLHVNVHDRLADIVADERKVKQIMLNLLSNAVKFTSAAGHVSVDVRASGYAFYIAVTDTGVGISRAHLDQIFEPFWSASPPSAGDAEGTGLGLALTKRLVELHGGSIRVDSEPGRGSTFTVELPAEVRAAA